MLRLLASLPLSHAANDDSNNKTLKGILIVFTFVIMALAPAFVLVFMYIKFLPFQSQHEYVIVTAIGLDMLLVWYFWPKIYVIMTDADQHPYKTPQAFSIPLATPTSEMRKATIPFAGCAIDVTLVQRLMSTLSPTLRGELRSLVLDLNALFETSISRAKAGCMIVIEAMSIPSVVWNIATTLSLLFLFILFSNPDVFHIRNTLDVQNRRLYANPQISPPEACRNTLTGDRSLGLNLRNRSFIKANLSGSYLCNAILESAHLQGATMTGIYLQGANLNNAYLQGADLRNARMQGVNMREAQLQDANMRSVRLQGAQLNWYTDLRRADLTGGQIQGADLSYALLQGTVLWRAQLQGVDLTGAELQGAILWEAQLQGAVLRFARLQGADLGRTQLQGANLERAMLQGVVSYRGFQELRRVDQSRKFEAQFVDSVSRRVDNRSEISEIVFVGGLAQADVDAAVGL